MEEKPSLLLQKLKDEINRYKHYIESCGLPPESKTREKVEAQFKDKLNNLRTKLIGLYKGITILEVEYYFNDGPLKRKAYYVGMTITEVEDLAENVDKYVFSAIGFRISQVFESRILVTE